MKIRPLHNKLLIQVEKDPETFHGIFLPNQAIKINYVRAGIVEVGNDTLKKGQRVVFNKSAGYPVQNYSEDKTKEYLIVGLDEVFTTLGKDVAFGDFSEVNKAKDNFTNAIQKDRVEGQRKEYFAEIIQPWRGGILSREYVLTYPEIIKERLKDGAITQTDVSHSQYVWKDLPGWQDWYKKYGARNVKI